MDPKYGVLPARKFLSSRSELAQHRGGRPFVISPADPLNLVAAAVTPVVMVSATSILLSGVNTRYLSISDRIRAISHESRVETLSVVRCKTIRLEIRIFSIRVRLIAWAARMLYIAIGCFIFVALVLAVSAWRPHLPALFIAIFPAGLICVAAAIALALVELEYSKRTIGLEISELLQETSLPR